MKTEQSKAALAEQQAESKAIREFVNGEEDPAIPFGLPWIDVHYEQIGDDENTGLRLSRPIRVF